MTSSEREFRELLKSGTPFSVWKLERDRADTAETKCREARADAAKLRAMLKDAPYPTSSTNPRDDVKVTS